MAESERFLYSYLFSIIFSLSSPHHLLLSSFLSSLKRFIHTATSICSLYISRFTSLQLVYIVFVSCFEIFSFYTQLSCLCFNFIEVFNFFCQFLTNIMFYIPKFHSWRMLRSGCHKYLFIFHFFLYIILYWCFKIKYCNLVEISFPFSTHPASSRHHPTQDLSFLSNMAKYSAFLFWPLNETLRIL